MSNNVYFDTSIFIEMTTKKSKHKAAIRSLVKDLQKDKVKIYTSMITVQELAVASYRANSLATDIYGDISAIAKIYAVTKNVALTSAKREAGLKDMTEREESKRDKTKPETREQMIERICENRRRRWDCFHIATAEAIGCSEMYSTDDKLQKRPGQLGLKSLRIIPPGTSLKKVVGPLVTGVGDIEIK